MVGFKATQTIPFPHHSRSGSVGAPPLVPLGSRRKKAVPPVAASHSGVQVHFDVGLSGYVSGTEFVQAMQGEVPAHRMELIFQVRPRDSRERLIFANLTSGSVGGGCYEQCGGQAPGGGGVGFEVVP